MKLLKGLVMYNIAENVAQEESITAFEFTHSYVLVRGTRAKALAPQLKR